MCGLGSTRVGTALSLFDVRPFRNKRFKKIPLDTMTICVSKKFQNSNDARKLKPGVVVSCWVSVTLEERS